MCAQIFSLLCAHIQIYAKNFREEKGFFSRPLFAYRVSEETFGPRIFYEIFMGILLIV